MRFQGPTPPRVLRPVAMLCAALLPASLLAHPCDGDDATARQLYTSQLAAAATHHATAEDPRSQAASGLLLVFIAQMEALVAADGEGAGPDAPIGAMLVQRRTDALSRMADAALQAPDDVLVQWLLATQREGREPAELARSATRRLVEIDPGNVAAWLLLEEVERNGLDDAARVALLQRAAAAQRHSVYYTDTVRLLSEALQAVPLAPEVARCSQDAPFGASPEEAFALIAALGVAMAQLPPSSSVVISECRGSRGTALFAPCLDMARTLALASEESVGERIGLGLWKALAEGDEAETAAVQAAERNADWRQHKQAQLMRSLDPEFGLAWELTSPMWQQEGMSELDIQRVLLSGAGVELQAPPGFVSERERAVESARLRQAGTPAGYSERHAVERDYRAALAAYHATSASPRDLIVALLHASQEALVAVARADDAAAGKEAQAEQLAERVLAAAIDDPVVLWVLATLAPQPVPEHVQAAARERLLQVDRDNVAVWWLAGEHASSGQERAEALSGAAAAGAFRVYQLEFVRALAAGIAALPPPAALRTQWRKDLPGVPDEAHPWIKAMGLALALPHPSTPAECVAAQRDGAASAQVVAQCRAIGRTLAIASDSELMEGVGARLWQATAVDAADAAEASAAVRNQAWRSEQWRALNDRAFAKGGEAGQWALLAPRWQDASASETEVVRRLLREAGIPLEAPSGYEPPSARIRQSRQPGR